MADGRGARHRWNRGFAANISTPFCLKSARQAAQRQSAATISAAETYCVLGAGCGLGQID
jgi:hypothetical protein